MLQESFADGMPFSYRLSDIGRHYANYVGLMAHFDRVLPGRIHRVVYEDLVADPESGNPPAVCISGTPLPGTMPALSRKQAGRLDAQLRTGPPAAVQSGIAQWRPYELWLAPLKSSLGPVLDSYPHTPDSLS